MVGVFSGHWKQHETWDGTYSIDDLLDLHEMLEVKAENKRRAELASSENKM